MFGLRLLVHKLLSSYLSYESEETAIVTELTSKNEVVSKCGTFSSFYYDFFPLFSFDFSFAPRHLIFSVFSVFVLVFSFLSSFLSLVFLPCIFPSSRNLQF